MIYTHTPFVYDVHAYTPFVYDLHIYDPCVFLFFLIVHQAQTKSSLLPLLELQVDVWSVGIMFYQMLFGAQQHVQAAHSSV